LNNSFSYSGAVLWNSLPYDLRPANSLDDFFYKLTACAGFQKFPQTGHFFLFVNI